MRVLVTLRARADAAYDNAYHPKVRGRVWNALEDTKFDPEHDTRAPAGFCFSNPFPWGDIEEGEKRHLLVSSAREEPLAHVAADLLDDREFNIGEMPFEVEAVGERHPDVGEPGTRGTLETATGVLAKVPDQYRDDDHDTDRFWRSDDSVGAFKNYVEHQHERRVDAFCPDWVDGPLSGDYDLFDGYELLKTFAVPIEVAVSEDGKVTRQFVLSKWKFDYTVRDDQHRRALNLALDTGIGGRGELGMGFLVTRGGMYD